MQEPTRSLLRAALTAAAACFLFAGNEALADWHEASSDHFVIYADQSEKEVRKFADRLERYHSALSVVLPSKKTKPSPSNRVTIYVVSSVSDVRKLYTASNSDSGNARYLSGFYQARAGGSLAVIPPTYAAFGSKASESEIILMHEYAHHFMAETASYLIPRWFSEGYAEFFATAKFDTDGAAGLGLPAQHRAHELFDRHVKNISIRQLLDSKLYTAQKSTTYDNFYGRSWLLFHYLFIDDARRKQLVTYLNLLNDGQAELAAATSAFGDLQALDKALHAYQEKLQMQYIRLAPERLSVGPITVRQLSDAEGASMPVRIRSERGVKEQAATELVVETRALAEKYPDDSAVQATLAKAEFDAGNDEAAIRAADKALATSPNNMTALIQKGYALTRIATDTDTEEAWRTVRRHFVAVNRLENDHPVPLLYHYLVFLKQGKQPTENAVKGLEWALELAPYDKSLRMMVAQQQMQDKRFAQAIRTLSPLAYDPHTDDKGNPAIELLEKAQQELAAQSAGAATTR